MLVHWITGGTEINVWDLWQVWSKTSQDSVGFQCEIFFTLLINLHWFLVVEDKYKFRNKSLGSKSSESRNGFDFNICFEDTFRTFVGGFFIQNISFFWNFSMTILLLLG